MASKLKILIVIVAALLLVVALVLRLGIDTRYDGWSRYQDDVHSFQVLVPKGYTLDEENSISGFRGVRVLEADISRSDAAILSIMSVYSRDQAEVPAEREIRAIADQIAAADLKDYQLTISEDDTEGRIAIFRINGTSFIGQQSVSGQVDFLYQDGVLLVIERMLPESRQEELGDVYGLIYDSIEFVTQN